MKITLWGHRAAAFSTDGVYNCDEATPIVVLFVGGLMKSYQSIILPSVLHSSYIVSEGFSCHLVF
jgi:hypothetical protein